MDARLRQAVGAGVGRMEHAPTKENQAGRPSS